MRLATEEIVGCEVVPFLLARMVEFESSIPVEWDSSGSEGVDLEDKRVSHQSPSVLYHDNRWSDCISSSDQPQPSGMTASIGSILEEGRVVMYSSCMDGWRISHLGTTLSFGRVYGIVARDHSSRS